MSGRIVLGAILALVAFATLAMAVSDCGGGVRSHIEDEYERAGTREGAAVYTSGRSVSQVTEDITTAWDPADRVTSPAGVFLRYSDTIVAVHPKAGATGGDDRTEIEVADERRGYGLWFPFVGGWFGSSGRGGTVRGGGPGSGK